VPGYIKLYRDLQDNPIWQQRPFSKGQAWIDMIFRCNHICKPVSGFGNIQWVKRGEFISSNYKLAEAWGWSESAVRTFMRQLEYNKMILRQSFVKFSLYILQNYTYFQSAETEDLSEVANAQKTHRKRTGNAQKTPNNNDKNEINIKDIYIVAQHLSMSKEEYEKLVTDFGKPAVDSKIEYAQNYKKLKNYVSLYRTLNNWLKSDRGKNEHDYSDYV
jgi:NACalpha-BTF3-like transcription factor